MYIGICIALYWICRREGNAWAWEKDSMRNQSAETNHNSCWTESVCGQSMKLVDYQCYGIVVSNTTGWGEFWRSWYVTLLATISLLFFVQECEAIGTSLFTETIHPDAFKSVQTPYAFVEYGFGVECFNREFRVQHVMGVSARGFLWILRDVLLYPNSIAVQYNLRATIGFIGSISGYPRAKLWKGITQEILSVQQRKTFIPKIYCILIMKMSNDHLSIILLCSVSFSISARVSVTTWYSAR